jgi:hypothetical protein
MEITEHAGIVGHWTFTYDDGTKFEKKNLITGSGLNWFASLFIAETTNDVPFYIALGTGTAAATSSDVKLGAEGFRKLIASKSRQNNMVRLRMFLLQSEANGDWTEMGVFAAGTTNADSGTMINHLVSPISKAFNQLLTVECKIYFNAS